MRLFYSKEAPGLHGAYRFADEKGPIETVALFRTERDARRFVDAGNRSLTVAEENAALLKIKDAARKGGA
jgi:hypothetical protein